MFKFSIKSVCATIAVAVGVTAAPMAASAQSLSDVLNAVRQDANQMTAENRRRLSEFESDRGQQTQRLAALRAEFAELQRQGRNLTAEFSANEGRLGELEAQLEAEAGDFAQLLGSFREAANETKPVMRNSLASAEYSGRYQRISDIAEARTLPTRADLDTLPNAMLLEMIAQSEVKPFTADVAQVGPDGETLEKEVMRIGVFTAATTDEVKFVEMNQGTLTAFGRQPPARFSSAMSKLISASADDVVRAPVDPSQGDLFDTYGKLPGLQKRFEDGGIVGFVIYGILLPIGLLLGLFKLVTLFLMGGAMKKTARTKEAGDGNPLARVFGVYEHHKKDDIETLELKLDEQILKETPRIERFNDIIKVLAAVAPLLGLLGTVIGMIITFTAITIYGAGDPQLMADGISTALMTTVFGLVAAIPLLLIHALVAGAARGNQQILDEQAAGLVAERAEKGAAA